MLLSDRPVQPVAFDATRAALYGSLSAVALLAVSPLLALAAAAFMLLNLSVATPAPVRRVLGLTVVLAGALLVASRPIRPEDSNDIEIYYTVYQDLAAGDFSMLGAFADGVEIGLPALLTLWSWMLPALSVHGLMFCLAASSAFVFMLWVERSFYGRRARPMPAPVLLGVCLLMLNLYYSTQLSRQFLSGVILLFAFTAGRPVGKAIFVALAACFHLTAIPFYVLYLLVKRGRIGWLAIVLLALLMRLFFFDLLVTFDVLPAAIGEKLTYYAQDADLFSAEDLVSLRTMALLALVSIVAFVACRGRPSASTRAWIAAPWYTMLVQLLMLPIPLASLRGTLLIHSVLPGLLIYRMFAPNARQLMAVVLNLLLWYKIYAYAFAENGAFMRSTGAMVGKLFL